MRYVPPEPTFQDKFDQFLEFLGERWVVLFLVGTIFGLLHVLSGFLPQIWFANNVFFVIVAVLGVALGAVGFSRANM